MGQVLFVTGTDTDAGKTVFTALTLAHLRSSGRRAFAMKPFCTGSREDVRILAHAQDHELSLDQINPYHFQQPVAPAIAVRLAGRKIPLSQVLDKVATRAGQSEILLVEGAGGLLVPLGAAYTVADVVHALRAPVLLVVRNKLGAVNHTLLTLAALRHLPVPAVRIILMESPKPTLATRTNRQLIVRFGQIRDVFSIPFLGPNPTGKVELKKHAVRLRTTLGRILRNLPEPGTTTEMGSSGRH